MRGKASLWSTCGLIAMWPCWEQRTLTCRGSNGAFSDWLAAEKEILITFNTLVPDLPTQQTSDQTGERTLQWQYGDPSQCGYFTFFVSVVIRVIWGHVSDILNERLETRLGSHFEDALVGFPRDPVTLVLDEQSATMPQTNTESAGPQLEADRCDYKPEWNETYLHVLKTHSSVTDIFQGWWSPWVPKTSPDMRNCTFLHSYCVCVCVCHRGLIPLALSRSRLLSGSLGDLQEVPMERLCVSSGE